MAYQDNLWNRESMIIFGLICVLGFAIGILTGDNIMWSSIGVMMAFLSVYVYDWFYN